MIDMLRFHYKTTPYPPILPTSLFIKAEMGPMSRKYSAAIVLYTLCLVLSVLCLIADGGESGGFIDFSGLLTYAGLMLAVVGTICFASYMLLVYTYDRGRGAFVGTILTLLGLLMYGLWWWAKLVEKLD
jgi:hypothetical protein